MSTLSANNGPLNEALADLYRRFSQVHAGDVATYIPELGRADPAHFAICIATVDGQLYSIGDMDVPFTIQSVSKPFVYGLALADHGVDGVLERVGVEPSGEAFNAISLEPASGRPRNPMINAGAIAIAGLVGGSDSRHKMMRTIETMSGFAGRDLHIDEAVYASERETGHRNRAIAYLLRNAEIVGDDVDAIVDRYFRQCSVLVTCADLAMMAATLANAGENPRTGERVIGRDDVARVLSVMATCGMYDYAGSWLYRVGMPAKSGVTGGVIAVLPGQLGIGVFSPRLDEFGNSVRGVAVCEALSSEFGLHLLRPPVSPASAVMTSYSLAEASSKRRRSDAEMRCLSECGERVRIFRLQGPLVFSTAEIVLRRALAEGDRPSVIVFDCQRVHSVDTATGRLFGMFVAQAAEAGVLVVFAGFREDRPVALLHDAVSDATAVRLFSSVDAALEWCEDLLLSEQGVVTQAGGELPFMAHPMLAGLDPAELQALASAAERRQYWPGDRIIRQDDAAECVYLLALGTVSVSVGLADGSRYRLATMGPGCAFGEFALMDAEPRTADVDADTEVVCHALPVASLGATARARLTAHLARDLAARLRRADREIAVLAS